jgi:hypothetical protein
MKTQVALCACSILSLLSVFNCLAQESKGVGPITSLKISKEIDGKLAEQGKQLFETKCAACHKWEERYVGPALKGITIRRTPEWIMNMILNPQEMTQKDPVAKELFEEHLIQMTFQNVSETDARMMVEHFRLLDSKEGGK